MITFLSPEIARRSDRSWAWPTTPRGACCRKDICTILVIDYTTGLTQHIFFTSYLKIVRSSRLFRNQLA